MPVPSHNHTLHASPSLWPEAGYRRAPRTPPGGPRRARVPATCRALARDDHSWRMNARRPNGPRGCTPTSLLHPMGGSGWKRTALLEQVEREASNYRVDVCSLPRRLCPSRAVTGVRDLAGCVATPSVVEPQLLPRLSSPTGLAGLYDSSPRPAPLSEPETAAIVN